MSLIVIPLTLASVCLLFLLCGIFWVWRMDWYDFNRYGISILNGMTVPYWFLAACIIMLFFSSYWIFKLVT